MKANELRIGNWIEHDGMFLELYDFNNSLSLVTFKTSPTTTHSPGINKANIKPITLTEEWLKRFGFKQIKRYDQSNDGTGYLWSWSNDVIWFDKRENSQPFLSLYFRSRTTDKDKYKNQLLYVHQLQNLYFALTGEELTLSK